jgi:hypothetical protein
MPVPAFMVVCSFDFCVSHPTDETRAEVINGTISALAALYNVPADEFKVMDLVTTDYTEDEVKRQVPNDRMTVNHAINVFHRIVQEPSLGYLEACIIITANAQGNREVAAYFDAARIYYQASVIAPLLRRAPVIYDVSRGMFFFDKSEALREVIDLTDDNTAPAPSSPSPPRSPCSVATLTEDDAVPMQQDDLGADAVYVNLTADAEQHSMFSQDL